VFSVKARIIQPGSKMSPLPWNGSSSWRRLIPDCPPEGSTLWEQGVLLPSKGPSSVHHRPESHSRQGFSSSTSFILSFLSFYLIKYSKPLITYQFPFEREPGERGRSEGDAAPFQPESLIRASAWYRQYWQVAFCCEILSRRRVLCAGTLHQERDRYSRLVLH